MDYRPARRGLRTYLTGSVELAAATRAAAEAVAERARQLARVEAFRSGNYVNSIQVVGAPGDDRLGFAVLADVPYSAAVEFGNARAPEQAILRRAAETPE